MDLLAMRRDWDALARKNAMHYIETSNDEWELEQFFRSGKRDVEAIIVPDLPLICRGRDARRLRILEIGCGIGRMTKHLSALFGEVHGVDVSGEMVIRGRELLTGARNVYLHETSGNDLAAFPRGYFDFAFSYRVFEHIPYRVVIVNYMAEVHRVLKTESLFKFQLHTASWPARLLHSVGTGGGRSSGWRRKMRVGRPDTWFGVRLREAEIDPLAHQIGFAIARRERAGPHVFWNWWLRRDAQENRPSLSR